MPLFWDTKFAASQNCTLAEITITNGRKFLLSFQIIGGQFLIPGRLTYGGFFPVDKDSVTEQEVSELMTILRSDYIKGLELKWKLPPQYFSLEIFQYQNEWSNTKSFSEVIDINQHIDISNWDTRKMSKGNQKKLRQATSAKMIFKKATPEDFPKCYSILSQNRSAIGVQVTMKLTEIQEAMNYFPDFYEIGYLELHEEVVAMCLTVDIAPRVRYVLYWADNMNFRSYSPVTLLCQNLIENALLDDIQILDLGISSDEGSLNEGLYRFKHNLGAESSHKKTILSYESCN